MNWYYVATGVLYVLVHCLTEEEAKFHGQHDLNVLIDEINSKMNREIRIIRLASDDEIDLWVAHQRNLVENQLFRQFC